MSFPRALGVVAVMAVVGLACGGDDEAGASGSASSGSGGQAGSAGTGGSAGSAGSGGGAGGSSGSGGASGTGGGETFGQVYSGGEFHLGPVDYEESQWHNACAPGDGYASDIRQAQGELLAGLWNGIPNVAQYCDACIAVTTAMGKSALLRVVTYGDTSDNSIDVSPAAFEILDSGEYPRHMSWQFAKCPDTGAVFYEFQTGSSEWWTSLWVRNARLPLEKVEVRSPNHASYVELERAGDGTLTDAAGFGQGEFTLRLTATTGEVLTDTFAWPSSGIAGQTLRGAGNFP